MVPHRPQIADSTAARESRPVQLESIATISLTKHLRALAHRIPIWPRIAVVDGMKVRARLYPMPSLIVLLALYSLTSGALSAAELSVVDQDRQPVADAVVSFHPLDRPAPETRRKLHTLGQEKLRFVPHVLVIRAGDEVNFPNRDPVRHHIYSFSETRPLEIKLYSGLPASPLDFPKPGVVVLGCNIHDWMLGFVVVLDTPWWSQTDAQGQISAMEIPAGRYRIDVWHSRVPSTAAIWSTVTDLPLNQPLEVILNLAPAPDLDPPQLGLGSP